MAKDKTNRPNRRSDGTALIDLDRFLEPYANKLKERFNHYKSVRSMIADNDGCLENITSGYKYFGFNRGRQDGKKGIWYREWAPGAKLLSLVGDFNNWDTDSHIMQRDKWGVWHIFLPDIDNKAQIQHKSLVKVCVQSESEKKLRIPAYITRAVQDENLMFCGQYWNPSKPYKWQHKSQVIQNRNGINNKALRIYEAHIGMAQEKQAVGTYKEFTKNILPRIVSLGYNTIQLMAIMEHPYYGSFGYHVSNFFAASSRFGTPEQLKQLIDTAHGMGLKVIMDIVHSHSIKNIDEGLNNFDTTNHQYFHAPPRGEHSAWDSLCFDYSKYEVLRFLLSNVRYWLEEYHFDGYRFDGVTSMLYLDHGMGSGFNSYDDYFSDNVDEDAVSYLMLANQVAHSEKKLSGSAGVSPASKNGEYGGTSVSPVFAKKENTITIAEDMSGMPGLARPVQEGGLGFDYRLAMGVADFWIKLLKEKKDENWNLSEIYHTLLNRRDCEKHIGYAESHDQALVGDKTLAFRLMDAHMYSAMEKDSEDLDIERGVALHKMIRLITFSLAGEGYLNFMGNEFGHPEWIDFPRSGNNFSYNYACRQWNLADNNNLRYSKLLEFDRAMQNLDIEYDILNNENIKQLALHEDTKQLVYNHGDLVFVFNFHPNGSYRDLRIPIPENKDYKVILNSDDKQFGGFGRVEKSMSYPGQDISMYGCNKSIQIYLPARSAQVLAPL